MLSITREEFPEKMKALLATQKAGWSIGQFRNQFIVDL
jgi:hypothetical protein